jgi:hypothetical protein
MQDAHVCVVVPGTRDVLISVISDGAGSASFGGQGASLACRTISQAALSHIRVAQDLPSNHQIQDWVDSARDRIITTALRRSLLPRDFASTLILSISDGVETVIAHIGDGSTVLRDKSTAEWIAPSWPAHGEYASTTNFLTDEHSVQLRITRHLEPIDALVSFTDGLEKLALDFVNSKPYVPFFNAITRSIFQLPQPGRDQTISNQLELYLNSDAINQRTDDDKTLVIATLS